MNLEHAIEEVDLVIGAVLIPGASAPKLGDAFNAKNHETR